MIQNSDRANAVAFALGLGALAVQLPGVDHALRFSVVLLFVSLGPGLSLLGLIGVRERLAWAALVVPISLAVGAVVSETLVVAGLWSPTAALVVLLVACAISAWMKSAGTPQSVGGEGET